MKTLTSFILLTIIIICNYSRSLYGQNNIRSFMLDPSQNFYEIQQQAIDYFEIHGKGRGSGYKQYKRWEYRVSPKVYPSGDMSLFFND